MNEWISLKDSEPDNNSSVLIGVVGGDCVLMSYYKAGMFWGYDDNPEPWTDVTHWMPLPPPPEDV